MNRTIRKLRRDLEKPRPKGYEPFDRYAYNVFSWHAAYWADYGKTEEERTEAVRLKNIALQKGREMSNDQH